MAMYEDQEASFTELWSEKPYLYHVNSKSCCNEIEKREAVEEISIKLELTADSVNKYIALRTQYALNSRTNLSLARLHKVT